MNRAEGAGARVRAILAHPAFLPAALGVGALLRAAHLVAWAGSPLADDLQLDHLYYDRWASRIANGELVGDGPFFVDPLYAYVLGGVYSVIGRELAAVRVLQAALGLATAYLVARSGRALLRDRALGNLAGAIAAIYVPAIYYEGMPEKTALSTFLVAATFTALVDRRARAPAVAGVLAGLAILSRANLMILLPVGVLVYLVFERRPRWPPTREALRRSLAFAGPALLVTGLATMHNASAGEVVWLTTNAGQNLYVGNHAGNELGTYHAPDFVRPNPEFEEADFHAEAERRAGRQLDASEVSDFWRSEALDAITNDAGHATSLAWRKLVLALHRYEPSDNDNVLLAREVSPVLNLPFPWWGDLVPLALLGAIVGFRRRRSSRALTVFLGLYVVGLVAFFVFGRFRVPMLPAAAVLAATGVGWLARNAMRHRARVGASAAAAVALWIGCTFPPAWLDEVRSRGLAIAYYNLGTTLHAQGDREGAIELYEHAAQTHEASVILALRTLGELYLERGDYDLAEARMRSVVEHRPESQRGHDALIRLYEAMDRDPEVCRDPTVKERLELAYRRAGRTAEAARAAAAAPCGASRPPPSAQEVLSRAQALRAEGRFDEAIQLLQDAVAAGPYDENTRYMLGALMEQHADPDAMIAYWTAQAATDPKPQTSHYFRAVGFERAGRTQEALAALADALDIDPAHEMSHHRWGMIHESHGQLDEALSHYEQATRIHPEFRMAHESAARVLRALGRDAEAVERDRIASESEPGSPRRYLYWGRFLLEADRPMQAIPELELAVAQLDGELQADARDLLSTARRRAAEETSPPGPEPTGSEQQPAPPAP